MRSVSGLIACWVLEAAAQHSREKSKRSSRPEHDATGGRRGKHALDWRPLVGRSVDELLRLHPDPLAALRDGEYSAIILREAVVRGEAADISSRLWKLRSQGKLMRRGLAYATFGLQLHDYLIPLNHSDPGEGMVQAQRFARDAHHAREQFAQHRLMKPVNQLHQTLAALHARKPVITGPLAAAARANDLAPGNYHLHSAGHSFLPHADTMRSGAWMRTCRQKIAPGFPRQLPDLWPAAFGVADFEHQFSALLMLQPRDRGAEVHLFDTDYRELLDGCRANGRPYEIGIQFPQWYRDYAGRARTTNVTIEQGDFYLINSNRVHHVPSIAGGSTRVVLQTFVGYSRDELRVWA